MPTLHRFFYALRPPPEVAARIGAVRDGVAGLRSRVADGRLHVTLGLGEDFADYPEAVAARMGAIGEAVRAAAAEIVLDRMAGSRASVALRPARRSPELDALAHAIGEGLRRAGLMRAGWRLSPHVTLGYLRGEPFDRALAPIAWEAGAFELIHSLVGETRHVVLGRWPLGERQAGLFG